MHSGWHTGLAAYSVGLVIIRLWVRFSLGGSCVTTLGKLFTPTCLCHCPNLVLVKGRWRSLVEKAWQKLMAASLGGWQKVTCVLTAYTMGPAMSPTLGKEHGRTLPFFNATESRCKINGYSVQITKHVRKWAAKQNDQFSPNESFHRQWIG